MTPDSSVLKELKALDPGLFVMFSEYELNKLTGQPLEDHFGRPVKFAPRWSVWCTDPKTNRPHFLFYVEDDKNPDGFCQLDGRVIQRLKRDMLKAGVTPKQQADAIMQSRQAWREKEMKEEEAKALDVMMANKRKIREVLENPNVREEVTRDAKIYSYNNQVIRNTSGTSIPKTDKERGWETPAKE